MATKQNPTRGRGRPRLQNVDWDKDPRYQLGPRNFFASAPDQADGFAEKLRRAVRQLAPAPRAGLVAGASADEDSFGEKLERAVERKQEQVRKPAPQPTEEAKQERLRWLLIEPHRATRERETRQ
jgi:hypothetical protein